MRAQLEPLPSVEEAAQVSSEPSLEQLQDEVASRRTALAEKKSQLARVNEQITSLRDRPVAIGDRLPMARRELADTDTHLASSDIAGATSPGRKAERTVLQAQRLALVSELQMLEQEGGRRNRWFSSGAERSGSPSSISRRSW